MKKRTILIILLLIIALFAVSLGYLYNKNKQPNEKFSTESPVKKVIVRKIIATGSIVPKEEIVIKPNISGIIETIFVEAGALVQKGDLIAKIRVIPNAASLATAENSVKQSKSKLENETANFNRQKNLLAKGAISQRDFDASRLTYEQAQVSYKNDRENLEIIKTGTTSSLGAGSNTLVRSTITGMVLDVPVKIGNRVIETNNFNEGTTIATMADVNQMIFEGKMDESEISKIKVGMPIDVKVGAIPDKTFSAVLDYIAPKGVLESGAVQFVIRGTLKKENDFIRPGLSANAFIIIAKTDKEVLAVSEALLQYDEDKKPYVEVKVGEQRFERRYVTTGISDGFYMEIKSGLDYGDEIKIWMGTEGGSLTDRRPRRGGPPM